MTFAENGKMDYFAALRAFVRSVELGSFSKAAAEQDLKVSTVSRYVSALEADLGAALLNRSTRRLNLTEVGAALYERAVPILADLEDARGTARSLNDRAQGLLRLNTPSAFGRRHIVPHIADFLAAYPNVRVDLTLTDATVDLIEAGSDLAIRIGALGDSSLVAKLLAPHRRVLVASPRWLTDHAHVLEPAHLASLPCLSFALQPTAGWYVRPNGDPLADPISVPVKGPFRANDSEALLAAAQAGLGAALLPTWLVGDLLRDGSLVRLLPDWRWSIAPGPEPAIWGVYPPKKVVSPKVRAFLDFIARRFGTPPYWDERL